MTPQAPKTPAAINMYNLLNPALSILAAVDDIGGTTVVVLTPI